MEKFDRTAPDLLWIRGLRSEGGWVIVSGDTRILRTPELKAEWLDSGLTAFFLGSGWMNLTYWNQIGQLVRWWPSILDQARLLDQGAGFEIPHRSPGRFKLVR